MPPSTEFHLCLGITNATLTKACFMEENCMEMLMFKALKSPSLPQAGVAILQAESKHMILKPVKRKYCDLPSMTAKILKNSMQALHPAQESCKVS